jgi:hypothetical protein
MTGLIGEIIPIGLLLALGPTRFISTILLLTSARPMQNALAFLAGVASLYLVVGSLTLLFFGRAIRSVTASTAIVDSILVVCGVILLVYAARSLFKAPDLDAQPSRWMQRITAISAGQAFLFGILLALSLNYLLIFLGGVALIYETGLSLGQRVIALLVLMTLALLSQLIPIALYAADSRRARVQLSALMQWLNQHNRVIMTGFSLVLGIIFLVAGLNGLIPVLRTVW